MKKNHVHFIDNNANAPQVEENEAALEQPPAYEDPPDYEEASSLKFDMSIGQPSTGTLEMRRKRRKSRSRSRSRFVGLKVFFFITFFNDSHAISVFIFILQKSFATVRN